MQQNCFCQSSRASIKYLVWLTMPFVIYCIYKVFFFKLLKLYLKTKALLF